MTTKIAFAVPGDIQTLTGGYLYDLKLMKALSKLGLSVGHMAWGDSFPAPTPQHAAEALAQLQDLPADQPAIVDGLAYGALETEALYSVTAPLFALVHHPLALEPGLDPVVAKRMERREKANLEFARHIFVTSPHTGAILRAEYGVAADKITVVLPGFDAPAQLQTAKADPPLILSVGILAHRKGHDVLLHALAQITDLDWQADIVGRDHEAGMTEKLSALIENLGLSGRVTLSGEVSDDALQMRYRGATMFALATRYEGYGIVFGEAMGYGLPIVSTRAGAVPETVGEQAGLLVDADDADAFADALRQMLSQPTLRADCSAASLRGGTALISWPQAAGLVRDRLG
jgi:glycosyltransferase involved in cell wall biosynthesis